MTMEQFESDHLATPLDLSMKKSDRVNVIDGVVKQGHSQPSDECPVDILNGTSRYCSNPPMMGAERGSESRRVAFVQPQRGQNIRAGRRGKADIREQIDDESLVPLCREDKLSSDKSAAMAALPNMQALEDTILQEKAFQRAQTLKSEAILIMTQRETMPFDLNQDPMFLPSLRSGLGMQNIHSRDILEDRSVSAEDERGFLTTSDPILGASLNAIAMSQLNRPIPNSLHYAPPGLLPLPGIGPYPELFPDNIYGHDNNIPQFGMSLGKDLPGLGDLNMPTLDETLESFAFSKHLQMTDLTSLRSSMNQLVPLGVLDKPKEYYLDEEDAVTDNMNTIFPDVVQGEVRPDPQEMASFDGPRIVSTTSLSTPSPPLSAIPEQHKTLTDCIPAPASNKRNRIETTKPQSNCVALFTAHEQSKREKLMSVSKDLRPSKLPQLRVPNNSSSISCRKILQEVSGIDSQQRCDEDREARRKSQLAMFHAMNRTEKAAFLREKYAKLLKLRNKQLQMMDPKCKISLRKSSQASREIQTLSKMTKLKCPPMIGPNNPSSDPKSNGQSGRASQTSPSAEDKTKETIVIDLTRDSDSPKDQQKEQDVIILSRPKCRLPSYDEAIAAKEMIAQTKLGVGDMSAVAKRLLSSSQEFLRNYQTSPRTSSPERSIHSGPKSVEDGAVANLDSLKRIHALHFDSTLCIGPLDADALETYPMVPEQHPMLTGLLSTAPPEVSPVQTDNTTSKPFVASQDTYCLETKDNHGLDANNNSISEVPATNRTMSSLEMTVEKRNAIHMDREHSSSHLVCASNGIPKEQESASALSPSSSKMATVYVGEEKHVLKNAVVRIQDIRKQSPEWNHEVENRTGDTKKPCQTPKRTRRRRRFSSTYEFDPSKRRRKALPSPDHTPSYLALEFLDNELADVFDGEIDVESTNDYGYDEDYSPKAKRAKRLHRKPKKSTSNSSDPERWETTPNSTADSDDSCRDDCRSSSDRFGPIRVEIGKNSENHIKLKFVNVRSIHEGANRNSDLHPSGRKQDFSPKTKHLKTHQKDQPSSLGTGEHRRVIARSPCKDQQNGEKICNTEVGSTNIEKTQRVSDNSVNGTKNSSDPPAAMRKLVINKKFGETYLHRAAKLGNMEVLRHCIENEVTDVNARDKAGYTSLHDSCVPGHLHVAEFLLDHGADANAEAYDGIRPLHNAIVNNHVELVRILLAYGADPFLPSTHSSGSTCIQQALEGSSEMRDAIIGYLESMKVPK